MKCWMVAIGVMILSIAPFWALASNIDSDEVHKTALSVGAVTAAAGIQALLKLLARDR